MEKYAVDYAICRRERVTLTCFTCQYDKRTSLLYLPIRQEFWTWESTNPSRTITKEKCRCGKFKMKRKIRFNILAKVTRKLCSEWISNAWESVKETTILNTCKKIGFIQYIAFAYLNIVALAKPFNS